MTGRPHHRTPSTPSLGRARVSVRRNDGEQCCRHRPPSGRLPCSVLPVLAAMVCLPYAIQHPRSSSTSASLLFFINCLSFAVVLQHYHDTRFLFRPTQPYCGTSHDTYTTSHLTLWTEAQPPVQQKPSHHSPPWPTHHVAARPPSSAWSTIRREMLAITKIAWSASPIPAPRV